MISMVRGLMLAVEWSGKLFEIRIGTISISPASNSRKTTTGFLSFNFKLIVFLLEWHCNLIGCTFFSQKNSRIKYWFSKFASKLKGHSKERKRGWGREIHRHMSNISFCRNDCQLVECRYALCSTSHALAMPWGRSVRLCCLTYGLNFSCENSSRLVNNIRRWLSRNLSQMSFASWLNTFTRDALLCSPARC